VQIAANVEDLHGPNNKILPENLVAENGRLIPSRFYTVNQHDILTGTKADGTAFPPDKDMTCGNWTKSGEGNAMVGHADRMGSARRRRLEVVERLAPVARLRRGLADRHRRRRPALLLRRQLIYRRRHESVACRPPHDADPDGRGSCGNPPFPQRHLAADTAATASGESERRHDR
jgi:hypothetical protein